MFNKQKIMEGIHLIAYVRNKQTKLYSTIEDSSYNTKASFKKDLEANGYDNISILDNRDMFLIDNTDYTRVSQLKNELKKLRDDMKIYNKDKYPTTYKDMLDKYNKLKEVYDKVMKIPLAEGYVLKGIQDGKSFDISYNDSEEKLQKFKDEMQPKHQDVDMYIVEESKQFKYIDEEDIPRYDSYIGLQMQIDWVKNRIKSMKSKIAKDKYDADRNKHKHILEYYEELLKQYKQAMKDIGNKESKNENINKYKVVDTNKLPDIKYELESRSENKDYNRIYQKVLKSKTGKIRCTYNELDLISAIYSDNDVYDYDKLNIQNILYEDYSFDSYNKKIEEYKNIKLNEFIEKLKNTYPKVTVSKPIHSKYSGDRIKLTHRNLIITIILMELLDTESGEPEYSISYNGRQQYIGTADDVIDYINKYIVSDYGLNENKMFNSKNKLEEVSRNELLAKTKGETITRYNKSVQYKGFSLVNINIDDILKNNTIIITCRVGDYLDTLELEDILYWIQIVAEKNTNKQINSKVVTEALMNAVDGMDIKIDCECGDWRFRLAYQATEWGYKYGTPETRPANIRNPNGFGALCKHLTALLSNKKWLQQVSSYLMDWCAKNIDKINQFLKLTDEDKQLTLPNELARQNAKKAFYTKLFKDVDNNDTDDVPNEENPQETDNKEDIEDTNKNTVNINNVNSDTDDKELTDINNTEEDEQN